MNLRWQVATRWIRAIGTVACSLGGCSLGLMACDHSNNDANRVHESDPIPTNPIPTTPPSDETFEEMMARLEAEKPIYMQRQRELLEARYDLSDRPGPVQMTRGKPVQTGVRVKLRAGYTWPQLAAMTPAE